MADPPCSDVARFQNVNNQAHIFVISDGASQAAIRMVPPRPINPPGLPAFAGRNEECSEVVVPPSTDPVGACQSKRQVNVLGAGPVRFLLLSDIPGTFSDLALAWY